MSFPGQRPLRNAERLPPAPGLDGYRFPLDPTADARSDYGVQYAEADPHFVRARYRRILQDNREVADASASPSPPG
ncbi:hypothetical protein D3C78_1392360 [compost metagenome]